MIQMLKKHQFLLEELIKRDFKKKYKGTFFGMAWSVLNPLLTLMIMRVVFSHFFGGQIGHYTIYLFCGTLVFSFFSESTSEGMLSLVGNSSIITKVNVPKYLFLLAKNSQTLLNFGVTLIVFFLFCLMDGVTFTWIFILLLYPVFMLLIFNMGMGLILSALYVFFRDTEYLYDVFLRLLMYLSAIFYNVSNYDAHVQRMFLINPVYLFIKYFRCVIIDGNLPSAQFHLLMLADTVIVFLLGCLIYKKNNTKFLYYV